MAKSSVRLLARSTHGVLHLSRSPIGRNGPNLVAFAVNSWPNLAKFGPGLVERAPSLMESGLEIWSVTQFQVARGPNPDGGGGPRSGVQPEFRHRGFLRGASREAHIALQRERSSSCARPFGVSMRPLPPTPWRLPPAPPLRRDTAKAGQTKNTNDASAARGVAAVWRVRVARVLEFMVSRKVRKQMQAWEALGGVSSGDV